MCSYEFRTHGGPLDAEFRRLGVDYADVLDFSVSTNPYGPCAEMLDAIRAAPVDRYPDPSGSAARRALGDFLGAYPDDIALGNGAAELLWSLADVLLTDGGCALVVEPTFCEFRAACVARGAPVVEWRATEEQGFAIDLDEVGEAARSAGATVIYLCAPNTPTGYCLPAAEIAVWAAAHHNIAVILDQSFLTLSDHHADIAAPMPRNVTRVRSLTKDHAIPGVRIGYAVTSPAVARAIDAGRPAWTVSAAAQAAAIAACGLSDFVAHSRAALQADRSALHSDLARVGLRPHCSSTVFLLAGARNAKTLRARLLARHRILVRDCASFGLPDFVRIAARPEADRGARPRARTGERPMLAPAIMVQGTASDVGKSLFVTGLCRLFRDEGLSVAPFKSQNMSLNSAVTPDGLEIGRAQAVQAAAARIEPTIEMNPVLLKPEGEARSQVVVMGKPIGSETARDYNGRRAYFEQVVTDCLTSLREQHDLVIIEGAGSPAEVNLKDRDVANMYVAKLADAPVLLVGDIDKGGVFASFVGTLALLDDDERDRVAAFVVNKFRGDVWLLQPGLDFLAEYTGKPTLGVLPYVRGLKIADEDSVSLEDRRGRYRPGFDQIDIAVVRFPRISNYDDVLALEHEPKVVVRFVETAEAAEGADLVILPGSKNTVLDLEWMRQAGIADVVTRRAENGEPVLGICGGCQMLGETIEDPHGVESTEPSVRGLGLLPIRTRFAREKITAKVEARRSTSGPLLGDASPDEMLGGYEIHMGVVVRIGSGASAYQITSRSGNPTSVLDGAVDEAGAVVGTMIHGLMDNTSVRADLLTALARRKGLAYEHGIHELASADDEYDRLADAVRASMDLDLLWRIAGISR